jgi:hypothetical protein
MIPNAVRPYLLRLGIVLVVSFVLTAIFNEAVYRLQKDPYDRPPQTIQLVIPAGTAERVAQGQSIPSLPEEMVFVIGDQLEVKNEDAVAHQLGPLWAPPGTSASLVMQKSQKSGYTCSFQTTQVMGIDVRTPTTFSTRLTALLLAGPTTAALLFLYSFLLFPLGGRRKPAVEETTP